MLDLSEFPDIVRRVVERTPESLIRRRGADENFAVVEHVWHLADLEEEGFAVRIERLLTESNPTLPDFRGDALAIERRYLEQPIAPAMERFARTRAANYERLRAATEEQLARHGTQEHVGVIILGDLPRLMHEHDRAHAEQMIALLRELEIAAPEALLRFGREG